MLLPNNATFPHKTNTLVLSLKKYMKSLYKPWQGDTVNFQLNGAIYVIPRRSLRPLDQQNPKL